MYSQTSDVQKQQLEANLFYLRLGVEILKQEIKEFFRGGHYKLLKPQETSKEHIFEEAPLEELVETVA